MNLLTRLRTLLFPPREIWKTESADFLRHEKTIECDWFGYTHWDVYAIYQRSLTGKTRVVEDWRVV